MFMSGEKYMCCNKCRQWLEVPDWYEVTQQVFYDTEKDDET